MSDLARSTKRPTSGRTRMPPSVVRWTALCALAEVLGMTAAASAAKASSALVGEPSTGREVAIGLSLVVAGGLVEGLALGAAQSVALRRWLPSLDLRGWVLVTVAVAGVGWAAASAPAVLGGNDGGSPPPLLLVLSGAALLGAAMGAVLGGAQALVLRHAVSHPWRWVGANVLAWAGAMPVIFLGATTPAADWSVVAVVGLGALTGLVAGSVLGILSGWFLPSLVGPSPPNRVVLWVLGSAAHRLLGRSLVALRVRGVVTGAVFELPVMYAADSAGLVVVPGRPESKRWWRNLRTAAQVDVLRQSEWRPAIGVVLEPGENGYDDALATYRTRWPRVRLSDTIPVVRLRVLDEGPVRRGRRGAAVAAARK